MKSEFPIFASLPSRTGLIPEFGGTSAWVDHFPFAYDFLTATRPKSVVEVGGAQIDAFLAFRQIARANALETACELVVHPEAGARGRLQAKVARELTGAGACIHESGEAARGPGTVDLLEIDGEVLGAPAQGEWNRWVESVRPGGWIWLHGCAPNSNGQPAADQFFKRVRGTASEWFLFHHGAGLGAWRKPGGPTLDLPWLAALAAAQDRTIDLARHYEHAGRLARAWMPAAQAVRRQFPPTPPPAAAPEEPDERRRLHRALDAHREREEAVRAELQEEQKESAHQRDAARRTARQLHADHLRALRAEARIRALQGQVRALNEKIAEADRKAADLLRQIEETQQTHAREREETLAIAAHERDVALAAAAHERALINELLQTEKGRVRSMQKSASWKLTLPLRWAERQLKNKPAAPKPAPAPEPAPPLPAVEPSREAASPPTATPETSAAPAPEPAAPLAPPPGVLAPGPIRFHFDRPRHWQRLLPGRQFVLGWCLAQGRPPMTQVRARCGARVFEGRFQHPRFDVAARYQLDNPAEPCGFDLEIDVPPGHSEWIFEFRLPGEIEWQEFHRRWVRALPVGYSRFLRRRKSEGQAHASGIDLYSRYLQQHDRVDDQAREHLARCLAEIAEPPLISVIMPTWESPVRYLQLAIDSVRRQIYPHWELCIADDASVSASARLALEDAARSDARIRLDLRSTRGHISESSNAAIALARGSWLALLDHDDELHPAALAAVALEIHRHPQAGVIYSDEDKIDLAGRRFNPYFKPDWNPDLLLGQNCISHLGCFRTDLVREVGGFRRGVEGCQDWDLALRVTDRLRDEQVRHIPRVLYHWRTVPGSTAGESTDKSYIFAAGRRALAEHFERIGVPGVELRPVPGWQWEVRFPLPEPPPRVSILIPTRDRVSLVRRCVESVLAKTDYPDFELVLIDNGSTEPETLAWFEEVRADTRVRILRYDEPFNYAAMHNWAVPQTDGHVLCLLNNDLSDLECVTPGWLRDMTALALRPQIGAVGALLLYPDDSVQHAGVVLGIDGAAGHAFRRYRRGSDGQMGRLRILQNYSAVTGACLVVRRALWQEVGGMDAEHLGIAFNDIDFCLRLRERGYRNAWTPTAEFTHHESSSRGFEDTPGKQARFERERAWFQQRWAAEIAHDPAYNPNLTIAEETFDISDQPRIKPWRAY